MPQDPEDRTDPRSVTVPGHLTRQLALFATVGAKLIQERDGDLPLTADMHDLLDELRRAARASATSGGPSPTVGTAQARWLSVADAAEQSGYSARRIRELAATGRLICKRIDQRTLVIDPDSLPAKGRQSVA
jgi:hypothetical protein